MIISRIACDELMPGDCKAIAGEKLILTAGALDVHVQYICAQLWTEVRSRFTCMARDLE